MKIGGVAIFRGPTMQGCMFALFFRRQQFVAPSFFGGHRCLRCSSTQLLAYCIRKAKAVVRDESLKLHHGATLHWGGSKIKQVAPKNKYIKFRTSNDVASGWSLLMKTLLSFHPGLGGICTTISPFIFKWPRRARRPSRSGQSRCKWIVLWLELVRY